MYESGALPAPAAPKKPAAYTQPASWRVTPGYGTDNNNQDSNKVPAPKGNAPDTHVCTPEGKPFA